MLSIVLKTEVFIQENVNLATKLYCRYDVTKTTNLENLKDEWLYMVIFTYV